LSASQRFKGRIMKSVLSKRLAIGATGLVLLGGGAVAVAATSSSSGSGRQAYIDDVAKHLNVTPGALVAAVQAARSEEIKAAVADGSITQAQADALQQRAQRHNGVSLSGYGLGLALGERGDGAVAMQYLGISAAALRSDRQSGKSLAQIASSTPGKSVDGLKAALLAAKQARLRHAAFRGLITTAQEQQRLAGLASRIEATIQRTAISHGTSKGGKGLR
jgi:hypothetical protein